MPRMKGMIDIVPGVLIVSKNDHFTLVVVVVTPPRSGAMLSVVVSARGGRILVWLLPRVDRESYHAPPRGRGRSPHRGVASLKTISPRRRTTGANPSTVEGELPSRALREYSAQ